MVPVLCNMKALGVEPKLPWRFGDSEEQEHIQLHREAIVEEINGELI